MSRTPSRSTIRDVALRAGCGVATVSRVLNGSGPVSPETRERVQNAVAALNYQINDVGRSLQSGRSRTIGCLVPSIVNPVFADAVQVIQSEVLEAGCQLLLMCSDYRADLEEDAVRMLLQRNVEGLILTVSDASASRCLSMLTAQNVRHCLMFNAPVAGSPAFFVDNHAASAEVARRFADQGHAQTGFLALRFSASDRSRQRFDGFRAACEALGMAPPLLLEIDETPDNLDAQLRALLNGNAGLTGLYASNDYLALATVRSARRCGYRIPQDLSVFGFDGIAIGELVEPQLATVVTDPRAMGRGAARAVLSAIDDDAEVVGLETPLPFEIRPGGSLGPPAPVSRDEKEAATSSPPLDHPVKDLKANLEQ